MRTSSTGQRERTMSVGDDEVNQNANRNNNVGGGRRSSQGPYRYSYDNTENNYPDRPDPHSDQEKVLLCITVFTIWLLMIMAVLFLIYYAYVLEWDPVMSDSVNVFGLEMAVNILYVTFVVDIIAGAIILISRQDYCKPHNARIFWIGIFILIISILHGIFIWLWVWTGEYPRTCSRNTFYYGKHCVDIEMVIMANTNSDGTISLGTCKCDYGQCLPECKGLREVQNYFWATYFLVLLRLVVLVMLLRPLRQAFCECQWCCCKNMATIEEGGARRVSQEPYLLENGADSGLYGKEGYNGSSRILPFLSETNNNSTLSGGDKSKMDSTVIGTRTLDDNSKTSKSGYDSVGTRTGKPSETSYGFNGQSRYSEDETFAGTTIKGTGANQDGAGKRSVDERTKSYGFSRYSEDETFTGTTVQGTGNGHGATGRNPGKERKMSYDFNDHSRYSEDETFTGTTVQGTRTGHDATGRNPGKERKMSYDFNDHSRYSEDETFAGTTIKGTGAGHDGTGRRPGKERKMSFGFTDYNRNSDDGTYTGTTMKGYGVGQDSGFGRARKPSQMTDGSEFTRTTGQSDITYGSESERAEPSKMTDGFTEYKRNSHDGTYTGTTIKGTGAGAFGQDKGCTRPTKISKLTHGFTNYEYKRNSADGTFTGTTIRETGTVQESGCKRATTDPIKMTQDSTKYKRNSEGDTFTGTTIKGTGTTCQDKRCTRPPNQGKVTDGLTEYKRHSADGTFTGTTIKGTGATQNTRCIRTKDPSKMTDDFTEYELNSEDVTFTGTTIKGTGTTGQDKRCTRPPNSRKVSDGLTDYKRHSTDGAFTGTTIKETLATQNTRCTRAKDPTKTGYSFNEYKRNSKDGTFTGTTMRGTAPSQDSECTRTTYLSGSSAYTDYTRDSADGTYTTGTTKASGGGAGSGCERDYTDKTTRSKEPSVKTGDGFDTMITIVPQRELIHSRQEDPVGNKEPVGKVEQGTNMYVHRGA